MGFIRGGFLIIVSVLLFFSLLTLNSFLTVSSSLQYDHVQEQLTPVVQDLVNASAENSILEKFNLSDFNVSKAIYDNMDTVKEYCTNYSDYVFSFENYTLTLPCDKINEGNQSPETILNETANSFVESVYYKEYNCGFWDCFDKKSFPFFLVSEKARDYWKGKFYVSLLVSLALIFLAFLLLEKKLNLPILVGALLVVSAVPVIKLGGILAHFIGPPFIVLFNIFFSQADKIFWISFFIGIFLIAAGIALRVVNSGAVSWIGQKIDEKSAKKKISKQSEVDVSKSLKKSK